jgi:hypothetical protein
MNTKLFYQAVLLGVITVLLGLVLSVVFSSLKPELGEECEQWNKYYVMEVILFSCGVLIRLALTTEMGAKYLLRSSLKTEAESQRLTNEMNAEAVNVV